MKITLCGSTKFISDFNSFNTKLTLRGHTVYSVATTVHGSDGLEVSDQEKDILDLVHFKKIMDSDAILVLNIDGYIGYSTNREIMWANMLGKKVYYYISDTIGEHCTDIPDAIYV